MLLKKSEKYSLEEILMESINKAANLLAEDLSKDLLIAQLLLEKKDSPGGTLKIIDSLAEDMDSIISECFEIAKEKLHSALDKNLKEIEEVQ